MASATIRRQPVLGCAVGVGGRGRLVRSDDRAARLDVRRSIYHSTSLRALCDEQVSPSGAVLFLCPSACAARPAVDGPTSGGVQLRAQVGLARRRAARSFAPRCDYLYCCPCVPFFFFCIAT